MNKKDKISIIGLKFSNITDETKPEDGVENSMELSETSPRNTGGDNVVIIEEALDDPIENEQAQQLSLHVLKTVEEHDIYSIELDHCKNLNDALIYLKTFISSHNVDVFFYKIEIDEKFGEFNENDLKKLIEKFKNKSVVFFFASKCVPKFSIYWKSKDLNYFLMIQSHIDEFTEDDEEIYKCMAKFLVQSLKNGHLGIDENFQLSSETNQIEIFSLIDSRGYNLLLLASEAGNANLAVKLLKLGLDLTDQSQNVNLQDLALQNGHFNVILALYKEDVPLPESIDIYNCPEDFKLFARLLNEFNEMVAVNNLDRVKEIFNQMPRTKYFYNFANESALKVATQNKSFDVYEYLVGEKLIFAPHEIPEDYYDDLEYDDQRIVREIHNKYTQELPEKHLNVLISKSFLSHDVPDAKEKLKFVHRAYRTLNANAFIKIILMIVAASKNFKIIFDFNRDSVNVADPTATSNTQGLFYLSGRIYIGARQLLDEATSHETLATIAHELCHLAMNLVYGNDAKPYGSNDHETMQEFEEISRQCELNKESEEAIGLVYGCYPIAMHHAELIVRVVHLFALYVNKPDKLATARDIFGLLFDFYEKKIVPEMREALPEIEGRAEKEIQKKDKKISKLKKVSIIFGILAILGAIGAVCVGFIFHTPQYNFNELSINDQMKVSSALVDYKNVQIKLSDLFPQNSTAYEKLTSDHITQVLNREPLNFSDPYLHYLDELVFHKWKNMTNKLKDKFLASNFTFQNETMKLHEMYEIIPNAFNALTSRQIIDVLSSQTLKVDKIISNNTKFYVERNFWDGNIYRIFYLFRETNGYSFFNSRDPTEEKFKPFYDEFLTRNISEYSKKIDDVEEILVNYVSSNNFGPIQNYDYISDANLVLSFTTIQHKFDKVLQEAEESKFFILSSEAGVGKTVTFEQFTMQIKKLYLTKWVSYIDLKEHTNLYNRNESLGNIVGLLQDILNLSSENEFERTFFEKLYELGEVVLLWNGFDEISSTYSNFVLDMMSSIHKNTNIIQFVCTRPLYEKILRHHFQVKPQGLVPLNEEKQSEFLRKSFSLKVFDENVIGNYVNKTGKIVQALSSEKDNFNTPLMLEMIADLISNDVEIYESENVYEIYEKFIKKKIEIWRKRGEFPSNFLYNSITDYRKFDMMQMYQMYALKSEILLMDRLSGFLVIITRKLKIMRQKIPKELTGDEISRMGILYINGPREFQFAHRTFAEFFVAQFFIENIYNAEDPDPEDAALILKLFFGITEKYGTDQIVITKFILSYLQTKAAKESDSFDRKIVELIDKRTFFNFIPAIKRRNPELLNFLLEFFKKDHKFLVKLLHVDENETILTALHNYAYFEFDVILDYSIAQNLSKAYLTDDEYERFAHGTYQRGIMLVSLYNSYNKYSSKKNEHEGIVNEYFVYGKYQLKEDLLKSKDTFFVYDFIMKNLTENEKKELLIAPTSPISTEYIFQQYPTFSASLTEQEQKHLFSVMFEKTLNSDSSDVFENFLQIVKDSYIDIEIFNMVLDNNWFNQMADKIREERSGFLFRDLWYFIGNRTNVMQRREILSRRADGRFIFELTPMMDQQSSGGYDRPLFNCFKVIFIQNIYKDHFNKTEMQQLILKSNDFLPTVIIKSRRELSTGFVSYLAELFKGSEELLKEYLLGKIHPSNLNLFEIMEGITTISRDIPRNLQLFSNLLHEVSTGIESKVSTLRCEDYTDI